MISYYDDKNTIHNNFKHDLKEFSLRKKIYINTKSQIASRIHWCFSLRKHCGSRVSPWSFRS